MGINAYVCGLIATGAVAMLARLAVDELKEWTPKLTGLLIDRAVKRLPQDRRERLVEEWRSHVSETPGCVMKFWHAWDCTRAARTISRESRQPRKAWSERCADALATPLARVTQAILLRHLSTTLRTQIDAASTQNIIGVIKTHLLPEMRFVIREALLRPMSPRNFIRAVEAPYQRVLEDLKGLAIAELKRRNALRQPALPISADEQRFNLGEHPIQASSCSHYTTHRKP